MPSTHSKSIDRPRALLLAALALGVMAGTFTVVATAAPIPTALSSSHAGWHAEGDQAFAHFGQCVATAGDVNGDGYSDVIIGAPDYDSGQEDEGRVLVFYGTPSGLSLTPGWTAERNQAFAHFGQCVATAGDVNGDGFSDVIVGDRSSNGEAGEGMAFVYYGSASGLPASPSWQAEGNQAGAAFGASVACAGDVNGDGYSDVIVGAPSYDHGQTDEGRAYVYLGSASGLSATPAWTAERDQDNAYFGTCVATAGDVNGDGYADVLVGDQSSDGEAAEGVAFAYYGSAAGLSLSPGWQAEANQAGAWFGHTVATAGDVDGDGFSDVLIYAPRYQNGETIGKAFLYRGSPGGLPPVESTSWSYAPLFVAPVGDVNGDGLADLLIGLTLYLGSPSGVPAQSQSLQPDIEYQSGDGVGTSMATAGDVNGDGFSDILVGAPLYDNGQQDAGRAIMYPGRALGLGGESVASTIAGEQSSSSFGASISSAGDVNGDGFDDVIVGAPLSLNGFSSEGSVDLYLGSAAGLSATASWYETADTMGTRLGLSVATAGDVNGDGFSDVIVGSFRAFAYVYHGSPSGLPALPSWQARPDLSPRYSVATAGDVNGDGFGDVIVGGDGQAYVYLGSAGGLATTPSWTGTGAADFGSSVASAGDVNGDGFGDVIIGAPGRRYAGQQPPGHAYVYLGSASGLGPTPAWTGSIDYPADAFGFSVSTAGDVDGDGFSDVIVGAPGYGDDTYSGQGGPGIAVVYYGSASGLSTVPNWATNGMSVDAQLGSCVATAGDLNGDGLSDVIVTGKGDGSGAHVSLYEGASTGLSLIRSWVGSQPGCVAAAGDVNGDAYGDVLLGFGSSDMVQWYAGNLGQAHPVLPGQSQWTGSPLIGPLGRSNSSAAFRIHATLPSFYGRTRMQMEHEVKPRGVPFNGLGTVVGPAVDIGSGGQFAFDRLVSGLASGTPYHWRVRAKYDPAKTPFQRNGRWLQMPGRGWNEADLRTAPAGVDVSTPAPLAFGLRMAGPNPVRDRCVASLSIPRAGLVNADVIDVLGRTVAVVARDRVVTPGTHTLEWGGRMDSGAPAPPGVYVLQARSGPSTQSLKVVLLR